MVGPRIGDGEHVVVDMDSLAFTAGAQVIVMTHQALVADPVDGSVAAITLDTRVKGRFAPLLLLLLSRGRVLAFRTLLLSCGISWLCTFNNRSMMTILSSLH